MLRAVDADTHIFESPQVWDFIDEQMHARRPIIVSAPRDTVYKRGSFWLIDGNIFPKSAGKGGFLLGTPTEPGQIETTPDVRARELLDIPGRLQAMDLMGVATQVVYPTLFLAYITDDVKLEVALCRSYNRFMAGVWEQAQGRLMWVVVPPKAIPRVSSSGPSVIEGCSGWLMMVCARCVCGSMPPGTTTRPAASITRAGPTGSAPVSTTAAMRSPSIAISHRPTPCGATTCPPRTIRSIMGRA